MPGGVGFRAGRSCWYGARGEVQMIIHYILSPAHMGIAWFVVRRQASPDAYVIFNWSLSKLRALGPHMVRVCPTLVFSIYVGASTGDGVWLLRRYISSGSPSITSTAQPPALSHPTSPRPARQSASLHRDSPDGRKS